MKKNTIIIIAFIILALITSISLIFQYIWGVIFGYTLVFISLLLMTIKSENLNKTLKKIFIAVLTVAIVALVGWISLIIIELNNFNARKIPLYAKATYESDYVQEYKGLGYDIHLTNTYDEETDTIVINEAEFTMFGIFITGYIS